MNLLIPSVATMLLALSTAGMGQSLGGRAGFNFLQFSPSPQLSSLGGINVSGQSNDGAMAFYNPALLRPSMHSQMSASFNLMNAGIKSYNLMQVIHHQPSNASLSAGLHYFNYGNLAMTDASGNIEGSFRPSEYVAQVAMAKQYMQRWHYGVQLKFIGSRLGTYRSSAFAADVGLTYSDTSAGLQAGLLIKNMGFQLRKYVENVTEELPFDLQMGVSFRFADAPLQLSFTGHHLHSFDIRYNDTAYNNSNDLPAVNSKAFSLDNIFRHIVIAAQFYLEDKIEITAAYNHLRRRELNIYNAANGLNGFSVGGGLILNRFQLRYARMYYQRNDALNQLGINLTLNKFF